MGWKMASPTDDLEASLLSFEKLDRASPDLWPEQLPGVAEFAASFKSPITSSPPKWMAEIERDDIDMLKELGSLTTANLMEKVRGLQNLAYQLGLDEYLRSSLIFHLLYDSSQRDDTGEISQHSREAQEVAAAAREQNVLGAGTMLLSQCTSLLPGERLEGAPPGLTLSSAPGTLHL
ncbi:protein lin-52 homolog isoform X2 [Pteropus alecto]|uniref:protein lin-52 homolog isoform X2 n=1 Tax=Pteropus alecto TaxID=9402 RepID=UPI0007689919|nr:protein lin-52 homolog isoform X2 [Pteropus alecto]